MEQDSYFYHRTQTLARAWGTNYKVGEDRVRTSLKLVLVVIAASENNSSQIEDKFERGCSPARAVIKHLKEHVLNSTETPGQNIVRTIDNTSMELRIQR